ncbi:MAG: hypothetical protein ACKOHM_13495, partial [Spartobacteria bacterium]
MNPSFFKHEFSRVGRGFGPRRTSAFLGAEKPTVTDSRYKSNLVAPFHARKPTPITYGQMAISPYVILSINYSIQRFGKRRRGFIAGIYPILGGITKLGRRAPTP